MGNLINISGKQGKITAYEARPAGEYRGGFIVIHEVWGLVDHTKDIADRLAAEGYLAMAPDLLSDAIDVKTAAGLQEDLFNPEKRNDVQPKLREIMTPIHNPEFADITNTKLSDCFNYLYDLPETGQNIAVIGFCFGGTYSFSLAVNEPRLKLALPFYGHSDHSVDELRKIKCSVRAFYGEKDENLMKSLPDLQDRMKQAGVDFEPKIYPNCGHAFFNDTNKFAYNKTAAEDAWQLVIKYLNNYA